MTISQKIILITAGALLCISCQKDAPTASVPLPEPPPFSGTWSGLVVEINQTVNFTVSVTDAKIQGSGNFGNLPIDVSGEENYPNVRFTVNAAGYQPATFEGTFTTLTSVSGAFNKSGFINSSITFTKTGTD